jgi:hypothetical protein
MTNKPFLALITPIGSTSEPPSGGQPPRPWGPINYPDQGLPGPQPGQPPRPWGPINYPDQGLPGNQPYPGQGLPGNQPYPDNSLPGQQPRPTHPIYYPPVIWDPSLPSNPIANPGDPNNPEGGGESQKPIIEWKTAWSPSTGWIVVGVPTVPVPTPSDGTE